MAAANKLTHSWLSWEALPQSLYVSNLLSLGGGYESSSDGITTSTGSRGLRTKALLLTPYTSITDDNILLQRPHVRPPSALAPLVFVVS